MIQTWDGCYINRRYIVEVGVREPGSGTKTYEVWALVAGDHRIENRVLAKCRTSAQAAEHLELVVRVMLGHAERVHPPAERLGDDSRRF